MTVSHRFSRRILLAAGASSAVAALTPGAGADDLEGEGYGLDEISREVAERGPLVCPKVELEHHRGTHLRYAGMATVYTGFRERLERMEQVAVEVGERVYGRPPRRLRHIGTLSCRRIRGYPGWISEHGLANAIDLEGFDFGPLPKGATLPDGLPGSSGMPSRCACSRTGRRAAAPPSTTPASSVSSPPRSWRARTSSACSSARAIPATGTTSTSTAPPSAWSKASSRAEVGFWRATISSSASAALVTGRRCAWWGA
jgi:hypothetical protein